MRERWIRFAARLYPEPWRAGYGVEFEALLEDASGDWRDVLDVLSGALKMHITTWAFGKVAAGFGVVGAILWSGLLFIAMPDKYTSDAVLRLTTVGMTTPSASDNTEEFVTSL